MINFDFKYQFSLFLNIILKKMKSAECFKNTKPISAKYNIEFIKYQNILTKNKPLLLESVLEQKILVKIGENFLN